MGNPVLVEVTRGPVVESRHCGAYVVRDADGAVVAAAGAVDAPVFPRSAVKALQVLPLIESGIADRFGLTAAEIALACASHSGEPHHAAGAASMLAKAGRDASCLECGAHWPLSERAGRALAVAGERPGALHNNCSGKHAGFVCLACGLDAEPAGYVGAEHPVQEAVRGALVEMTGAAHDADERGVDGCSIPTYATPLSALALAFARFGAGGGKGAGMGLERRRAAERVRAAVAAHPAMVAGTGRFDTVVMQALGAKVFTKTGAEGVFCASFPEAGLGVALKIDDGGTRASEALMAALIARFVPLDEAGRDVIAAYARLEMRNWRGLMVGEVRAVADA
jgi:L-asparaginase II